MDVVIPILLNLLVVIVLFLIVRSYYRDLIVATKKKYLTFWPRFWSCAVDSQLLLLLETILPSERPPDTPSWLIVIIFLILYADYGVYSICLHGWFGQTIGKMITRVKVVDARTEGRISFRHAFLRDCVPVVVLVPLATYELYQLLMGSAVGDLTAVSDELTFRECTRIAIFLWTSAEIITMLTNRKRRAIHDYIAGTAVVRTNIEVPSEDTTDQSTTCARPRVKRRFSSVFR